jgi:hypothetical protein
MDRQMIGDQMHEATERERKLKETAERELQDAMEREQRLLKLLSEQGIQVPTLPT